MHRPIEITQKEVMVEKQFCHCVRRHHLLVEVVRWRSSSQQEGCQGDFLKLLVAKQPLLGLFFLYHRAERLKEGL